MIRNSPQALGTLSGFRALAALRGNRMLWTIFVILVVLWLLGFSLHIAGGLIHILIVVAVIILIFNLISGGRRAG
jgi:Family of unknown function (DUF5670)